jgi:hypothetical protein
VHRCYLFLASLAPSCADPAPVIHYAPAGLLVSRTNSVTRLAVDSTTSFSMKLAIFEYGGFNQTRPCQVRAERALQFTGEIASVRRTRLTPESDEKAE